MIHALRTPAELRAACGDDDLVVWVGQRLAAGSRAWALGDAVVAAGPSISRRDRLAVFGPTAQAAALVRHALTELGPSYRPFGQAELIRAVAHEIDGLRVPKEFLWMSMPAAHTDRSVDGVSWLGPEAEQEVAALLAADAPDSYAAPGIAGVNRWAGIRGGDGRLAAVAADAWSAPTVGLLAGVATAAASRGRGLAAQVCGWVSAQLVAAYGRAALMVDSDNPAAIKVYERLGYRATPVAASWVQA